MGLFGYNRPGELVKAAAQTLRGDPLASIVPPSEETTETTVTPTAKAGHGQATYVQKGYRPHSKQAPYISPKEYGQIDLWLEKESTDDLTGPKGTRLTYADLMLHVKGFGGSGSGKTYRFLNQMAREIFRASHLPPGEERERKKPGLLCIEAKGDFAEKMWRLGQKYGRLDDIILLGPGHKAVYNTFADETETPSMVANKLGTLMDASNDGQKGNDPFWRNSAVELLTKIISLHRSLQWMGVQVPPMSFEFLALCLNDKGQALGQGKQSNPTGERVRKAAESYEQQCEEVASASSRGFRVFMELLECSEKAMAKVSESDKENEESRTWPEVSMLLCSSDAAEPSDEEAFFRDAGILDLLARVEKVSSAFLTHDPNWTTNQVVKELATRTRQLERLLTSLNKWWPDLKGGEAAEVVARAEQVSNELLDKMAILSRHHRTWVNLAKKEQQENQKNGGQAANKEAPNYGALKTMVEQYRACLQEPIEDEEDDETGEGGTVAEEGGEASGEGPERDSLLEYFDGNHFNEANDKTVGSVCMTALNMVTPLAEEPFRSMFGAEANFRIQDIITEGKIVVLHMPFAVYRDAARMAAILLKCDFFRAVQAQEYYEMGVGRPLFYLVDELGTVLTTGMWTGEKSFADKARGFNCACISVSQSIPMLRAVVSETEVDGLLTNHQTQIYLRNDDPMTQEKGAKASGPYERASAALHSGARDYMENGERRTYTLQYREETWIRPSDFKTFLDGECLIILPPHFEAEGKSLRRRVRFAGDPLDEICPSCGSMTFQKQRGKPGHYRCTRCGHTAVHPTFEYPFPQVTGMKVVEAMKQRWIKEMRRRRKRRGDGGKEHV